MNTQLTNLDIAELLSNPWVLVILVWSIVWKLIALWKSAKRGQKAIFIILGLVNTVGILEIIYILYLYFKEKKAAKVQ